MLVLLDGWESGSSRSVAALVVLGWRVWGRLLSFRLIPVRHEWHDDGGSYPPDCDGERRVEVWGRDGIEMWADGMEDESGDSSACSVSQEESSLGVELIEGGLNEVQLTWRHVVDCRLRSVGVTAKAVSAKNGRSLPSCGLGCKEVIWSVTGCSGICSLELSGWERERVRVVGQPEG